MAKFKEPQEWLHEQDYAYIMIVRRSGVQYKILASLSDVPMLSQHRWCVAGDLRANTTIPTPRPHLRPMHRIIMKAEPGQIIDHINGNYHDNRRENLRFCTQLENVRNQKLTSSSVVKYKGVSFEKDGRPRPYRASIRLPDKLIRLGSFLTPEEAAQIYDEAAVKYFGEFAATNKSLGLL